ncbi:MAG TPA: rod shape-determining protein MreC [Bacteroidota bacterium]|nr:rod shape-determining protein MreC [Bacteroidota bacterium]
MRTLLNILIAFKEYVLLILFLVISLILLSGNDNRQLKAVRAYTVGFLGYMQDAVSVIPNVFTLQRENEILRELNVNLSDEVSRLREARIENSRLRAMLGLRVEAPFDLVAADVVGKSLLLMRNTLTLNVGTKDGVAADMPIISEQGLVGKVIAVGDNYSLGQILLNKDFRAGAKVQRSRVDGILGWDGGSELRLTNVPKTQDVRTGDIVITSEYSNVFPKDITIGIVSSVRQKSGSLFHEISVFPAVEFAALEQVFVIAERPDSARAALEATGPAGKQ